MSRRLKSFAAVALALACGACSATSEGGAVLFDPDYALETFARSGEGITAPDGLAWHGDSLIVADEGGSAIRRLDADGWETLADERSGIISPEDVAVALDGTIYFTDDSAGGVWTISGGSARRVPVTERWRPSTEGIAFAPDGRLLVGETDKGRIAVHASGASASLPGGRIAKPESFAFDESGTLYVADNRADVLYRIDPVTGRRDTLSWPEVSPESIAFVGETLWLTDSHNGKVYRLADGRLETVAIFSHSLSNVAGIAGDRNGNVYVSIQSDLDAGRGAIVKLRRR